MGDPWEAVTALADASRRALYDFARRQGHPVSREEAAEAVHISRRLAAFHLDKLVDAGLLRARYEAPPGLPRGRGRTPKVYEPAADGLIVSIPQRRYELIAQILADAVADEHVPAAEAARDHAYRRGQTLGSSVREATGTPPDLVAVLRDLGFEPGAATDGRLLLHNCPFQALTARHASLICGLNHAFLCGLVAGLGAGVRADLVPRAGTCCVEMAPGILCHGDAGRIVLDDQDAGPSVSR